MRSLSCFKSIISLQNKTTCILFIYFYDLKEKIIINMVHVDPHVPEDHIFKFVGTLEAFWLQYTAIIITSERCRVLMNVEIMCNTKILGI